MKQLGEVQNKLGRRLVFANQGEVVENKGKESGKRVTMAEVVFFELFKGRNSGHGQGHTAGLDFR